MKNRLCILFSALLMMGCVLQIMAKDPDKRHTARFAGTYMFGSALYSDSENPTEHIGPGGKLLLYPETDSTMLFYVEVNRGAPTNNTGTMFGKLALTNNKSVHIINGPTGLPACKLSFQIEKKFVDIRTLENLGDCGFQVGVTADNRFFRYSGEIPEYYEVDGKKIYFEKTEKPVEKKVIPPPTNGLPQ